MSNQPAATSLALSAPHLLAEALRLPELEGFLQRRYVAPPDHAAILIRDGSIVDTFQGANFAVGGVLAKLKSLLVGRHHVRVVLADLRPFSLETPFVALTQDHVEVAAVATLELQIDPERATNALGLVGPTDSVGRADVLERFRPHLDARAVQAAVSRVNAAEIRGSVGLQDLIQADMMKEVERIAGDLGLIVRAVSLEFAVNEVEREAMERARMDREQAQLDQQLEDLRRSVARTQEATTFQLGAEVDVEKLRMASEEELARLAFEGELRLADTRDAAERRRELETISHEVEVLRSERIGRFENEMAQIGHLTNYAEAQARLRKIHREVERLDTEASLALRVAVTETEQDLGHRGRRLDLDHASETNRVSRDHIAGLSELERKANEHENRLREAERDGAHAREVARLRAEADARIAQLKAGATMTPEQILAINAGLSSDVAAVLAEQARANAKGSEAQMDLMREMVAQATDARVASESQAREMFQSAMDGAVGVAAGAGGGAPKERGGAEAKTVECAQCGRQNEVAHKFCIGCGNRLRV